MIFMVSMGALQHQSRAGRAARVQPLHECRWSESNKGGGRVLVWRAVWHEWQPPCISHMTDRWGCAPLLKRDGIWRLALKEKEYGGTFSKEKEYGGSLSKQKEYGGALSKEKEYGDRLAAPSGCDAPLHHWIYITPRLGCWDIHQAVPVTGCPNGVWGVVAAQRMKAHGNDFARLDGAQLQLLLMSGLYC